MSLILSKLFKPKKYSNSNNNNNKQKLYARLFFNLCTNEKFSVLKTPGRENINYNFNVNITLDIT